MNASLFNAESAEDAEDRRVQKRGMTQNQISEAIIGAAIEVHRALGPGLVEKAYEEALCHELHLRKMRFARQRAVPISYKGTKLSANLWLDVLVEETLVVDLKAKESVTALDKSQLLTYLRLSDLRLGLIINFHVQPAERWRHPSREPLCGVRRAGRSAGPAPMNPLRLSLKRNHAMNAPVFNAESAEDAKERRVETESCAQILCVSPRPLRPLR